jgi:UDP-GlcNAc:undecaprenyl-phosphate GlcNAc-1-phosphate transferase
MFKLYFTAFFFALVGSLIFVPFARWLSKKFGVFDHPGERKIHSRLIPRWGGIGLYLSFLFALFFLYLLWPRFSVLLAYKEKIFQGKNVVGLIGLGKQLSGILIAASIIFFLGIIDDKKTVPPLVKLLVQIIAAYVAIDYGVRISGIALPFGKSYFSFPLFLSQIVTVVWLILFINSVNLIDGVDGLAAGIVAICAFTFCVIAVLQGETKVVLFAKQCKLAAILSAALCGVALGFLYFNFYPAKIFMGDSGSMFLGFLLGAITVIGALKVTALVALFIPLLVFALPVLEMIFTIFRRWKRKKAVFTPDDEHFHHRLLKGGWTQREVVFLMYLITFVLSEAAILLAVFRIR